MIGQMFVQVRGYFFASARRPRKQTLTALGPQFARCDSSAEYCLRLGCDTQRRKNMFMDGEREIEADIIRVLDGAKHSKFQTQGIPRDKINRSSVAHALFN